MCAWVWRGSRDTVVILRDVLWLADRSDLVSVDQRLKHRNESTRLDNPAVCWRVVEVHAKVWPRCVCVLKMGLQLVSETTMKSKEGQSEMYPSFVFLRLSVRCLSYLGHHAVTGPTTTYNSRLFPLSTHQPCRIYTDQLPDWQSCLSCLLYLLLLSLCLIFLDLGLRNNVMGWLWNPKYLQFLTINAWTVLVFLHYLHFGPIPVASFTLAVTLAQTLVHNKISQYQQHQYQHLCRWSCIILSSEDELFSSAALGPNCWLWRSLGLSRKTNLICTCM